MEQIRADQRNALARDDFGEVLPSSAPTSFPTTQPFGRVTNSTAVCTIGERQISQGFYPGLGGRVRRDDEQHAHASTGVPSCLQGLMPNAAAVNAKMTVYLPLTLSDLLYCMPGLKGSVVQGGSTLGPDYGPQGRPFPNPIPSDFDPKGTLFPNDTPSLPPDWNGSGQSFNDRATTGVGSAGLGRENY